VCVHVFIGVNVRTCMSIYVYTVFLKKEIEKGPDSDKQACNCYKISLHEPLPIKKYDATIEF
jgi:hypothetical protein